MLLRTLRDPGQAEFGQGTLWKCFRPMRADTFASGRVSLSACIYIHTHTYNILHIHTHTHAHADADVDADANMKQ